MTFEIKLRVGFFKTRCYRLIIAHRKILLTPHDDNNEQIIIDDKELISIDISKKGCKTGELEIISQNRVYIGNFVHQRNLKEVCRFFAGEFGNKFISQYNY
ncbi:MAG: hypothetical protein PHO01_12825 [Desulfotomaculaceae bacterium]|nr:hypothetical protein [Desulfotomaculaceae bacterium]